MVQFCTCISVTPCIYIYIYVQYVFAVICRAKNFFLRFHRLGVASRDLLNIMNLIKGQRLLDKKIAK